MLRANQMDGDTLRIEQSDGMLEEEGTMVIRGRLVDRWKLRRMD